ncbi:unnamed protein product [Blepharisma stoltei]|uniref:Uncharacterized protein n=1 Tax=Blepharisma stoltei TaxID=1481888 RepID=A0AAU9J7C6_9CILI|nr:unnamed protein product [Blepharisma stoltei]
MESSGRRRLKKIAILNEETPLAQIQDYSSSAQISTQDTNKQSISDAEETYYDERVSFKDLIANNKKTVFSKREILDPLNPENFPGLEFSSAIYTQDEEDTNVKSKSKRKKPKRISAPKLPRFNKMIDFNPMFEGSTTEFEYLRDQPLELPNKMKTNKDITDFLTKCKQDKQDKSSYLLAKNVLTDGGQQDSLIIKAPEKLEGFISKKQALQPRDLLRENLMNEARERRMNYISPDMLFNKSSSELTGRKNEKSPEPVKEEKIDIQRVIELENGVSEPIVSEKSINSQNSEHSEESESSNPNLSPNEKDEKNVLEIPSQKFYSKIIDNPAVSHYFETEAEQGSDNEEHDNYVRPKEFENEAEEVGEVDNLIDHAKVDDKKEKILKKHLGDMIVKDFYQITKVINADFKGKRPPDYLEESNLDLKKMKLMKQQKDTLEVETKDTKKYKEEKVIGEDLEKEEHTKLEMLKNSQELKYIRNISGKSIILDEKSRSYLNLIEEPNYQVARRSLLSEISRSWSRGSEDSKELPNKSVSSKEKKYVPVFFKRK